MKPDLSTMVRIPAGLYQYHATHRFREGGFILYDGGPRLVRMAEFFIDRFEVTNREFKEFLDASGYQPRETHNFLRHWQQADFSEIENHPVTWIDKQDALAYASWKGKRLPLNIEWQRSAQGDDPSLKWPWGNEFHAEWCNSDSAGTSAVDQFPKNTSPFGVSDLVGNVWELTAEDLSDGWHDWVLLRGGSYYQAKGSMWYTEGGAQPLHHLHKFLLMNPSLNRCATIGFRCAWSEGYTVLEGYVQND